MSPPVTALILAAGQGTRMRSALPKVLHPLCGRPMGRWVVEAARGAGCAVRVVVGHAADRVRAGLGEDLTYALQAEQRGTGHAVACAAGVLPREGVVVVLAGDTPLVRAETIAALVAGHAGLATVLTFALSPDEVPQAAYGRLLRDEAGRALGVIEAAEASPAQRLIREVNSGVYAFDARWLVEEVLPSLKPHPPKGELYLTDAVEAAARAGGLTAVCHPDGAELLGVNDKLALAGAEAALRARVNRAHMLAGVRMVDPASTFVDVDVTLGEDVWLGPGVVLEGACVVEAAARVEAHAVLKDTRVAAGARVRPGTVCEGAVIGEGASVGPMAHLREGTVLGPGVRVGNFVETKKARFARGAKASHLSYVGDAEVGEGANLGAGTITCNYDGFAKHRTVIGAGAFVGSNSALVAPVELGAGAIVGAGSVITRPVAADALALARAEQREIPGMASRLRASYAARAGKAP